MMGTKRKQTIILRKRKGCCITSLFLLREPGNWKRFFLGFYRILSCVTNIFICWLKYTQRKELSDGLHYFHEILYD